jgi:hypothetical protein
MPSPANCTVSSSTRGALVTPEYRYTRNSKGEEQLFNLLEDPDEMRDLKKVNEGARVAVLETLTQALMAADDSARGAPAAEGQ